MAAGLSRWVALAMLAPVTLALAAPQAAGQARPDDLTQVPPVPTDYEPARLPWGDYDFTGIWPNERLQQGGILFQRPSYYGNRAWVTDEEFARRLEAARGQDGSFAAASEEGVNTPGTQGLVAWFEGSDIGKRTSLLISPANGQLPPLTPEGQRLFEQGRSGWVPGQGYDWVDDFDSWDRCITRGFPAVMFPNRYNNGLRIFQSPGAITLLNEMLGRRIVRIYPTRAEAEAAGWPPAVEAWMGNSRGWWEGRTLVIETTNIHSGDAVTRDIQRRSASPVIVTMIGGAPLNTIPMSPRTHITERLTMTGPDAMVHELTYDDPATFTAPWTARSEWTRDEDYEFYEYACHEGNVQLRNYITASRAHRAAVARGETAEISTAEDDRSRFTQAFDWDPGTGPRTAMGASE
jgi:hypothetical protein